MMNLLTVTSKTEKSFDKVVVKLTNYDSETRFVRISIPLNTIEELSVKNYDPRSFYVRHGLEELSVKKTGDPRSFYVRHGLEPCSPLDLVYIDGPFSTIADVHSWCPVSIRSFIYSFAMHSPLYFAADFSQSPPNWNASDLPFKMTITKLLSIEEKIYVFGFEKPGVLSAYTFDLDKPEWKPLSLPLPADLKMSRMVIVAHGKMILMLYVGNQGQFVYDPKLQTWTRVNYKDLLCHFCRILDYPMSVEEHNTIYWIDSETNMRAFDYQLCKHYYGPIVGFAHEPIVRGRESGALPLLHLKGDLFGIVWNDHNYLHLTLLHVSRGPKARSAWVSDHHLFVNVVTCFHHRRNPGLFVHGAYKLS